MLSTTKNNTNGIFSKTRQYFTPKRTLSYPSSQPANSEKRAVFSITTKQAIFRDLYNTCSRGCSATGSSVLGVFMLQTTRSSMLLPISVPHRLLYYKLLTVIIHCLHNWQQLFTFFGKTIFNFWWDNFVDFATNNTLLFQFS